MKTSTFLFLAILFFMPVVATFGQEPIIKKKRLVKAAYTNIGVSGLENIIINHGFQTGLNVDFRQSWGLSAQFNLGVFESRKLPSDYVSGLCIFDNCDPKDFMYAYTIRTHKYWQSKNRWKWVIAAGPAFNKYDEKYFTPRTPAGWLDLGSNYNTHSNVANTIGLSTNVKTEVALTPGFGLSIGLGANFNKLSNVYAIEFSVLFGYLKDKPEIGNALLSCI